MQKQRPTKKSRWQCTAVIKAKDLETKTEINSHTFIMSGTSAETLTVLFSKLCNRVSDVAMKEGFRPPSKQNRTVLEEGGAK